MSGLYVSLAVNVLLACFIQWEVIRTNKERAAWLEIIDAWKGIAASRLAEIERADVTPRSAP